MPSLQRNSLALTLLIFASLFHLCGALASGQATPLADAADHSISPETSHGVTLQSKRGLLDLKLYGPGGVPRPEDVKYTDISPALDYNLQKTLQAIALKDPGRILEMLPDQKPELRKIPTSEASPETPGTSSSDAKKSYVLAIQRASVYDGIPSASNCNKLYVDAGPLSRLALRFLRKPSGFKLPIFGPFWPDILRSALDWLCEQEWHSRDLGTAFRLIYGAPNVDHWRYEQSFSKLVQLLKRASRTPTLVEFFDVPNIIRGVPYIVEHLDLAKELLYLRNPESPSEIITAPSWVLKAISRVAQKRPDGEAGIEEARYKVPLYNQPVLQKGGTGIEVGQTKPDPDAVEQSNGLYTCKSTLLGIRVAKQVNDNTKAADAALRATVSAAKEGASAAEIEEAVREAGGKGEVADAVTAAVAKGLSPSNIVQQAENAAARVHWASGNLFYPEGVDDPMPFDQSNILDILSGSSTSAARPLGTTPAGLPSGSNDNTESSDDQLPTDQGTESAALDSEPTVSPNKATKKFSASPETGEDDLSLSAEEQTKKRVPNSATRRSRTRRNPLPPSFDLD